MNFPNQISFKLIDKKTKKTIGNIAVSLILYAHKKNDYFVGPIIANNKGIAYFEKEECIREIESSKKFYLMDYTSSLEECLPKVSIKIKPKNELDNAIEKMRKLRHIYKDYWDCSEEYLVSLENTDNDKYISKTYNFSESDIWQNKILEIELEKAKNKGSGLYI